MIKIAPSILSADFGNMAREVQNIATWGADIVHCDVMDGVFVPNLTFGMPVVKAVAKVATLPIDVHLMISEPEKYALQFVSAGANSVSFHPEASKNPFQLLQDIHAAGAKSGFVLNPNITFQAWKHLVPYADYIVIMSVYAGFGGQSFMSECLDKVREVKRYLADNNLNLIVEIDGGITEKNARAAVSAGADWLVAGSAVFLSDDPKNAVAVLKNSGND